MPRGWGGHRVDGKAQSAAQVDAGDQCRDKPGAYIRLCANIISKTPYRFARKTVALVAVIVGLFSAGGKVLITWLMSSPGS